MGQESGAAKRARVQLALVQTKYNTVRKELDDLCARKSGLEALTEALVAQATMLEGIIKGDDKAHEQRAPRQNRKYVRRKKAESAEGRGAQATTPLAASTAQEDVLALLPRPWVCSRNHEFPKTAIVEREKGGGLMPCCPICGKANPNIWEKKD
jgi:hypothetical protein